MPANGFSVDTAAASAAASTCPAVPVSEPFLFKQKNDKKEEDINNSNMKKRRLSHEDPAEFFDAAEDAGHRQKRQRQQGPVHRPVKMTAEHAAVAARDFLIRAERKVSEVRTAAALATTNAAGHFQAMQVTWGALETQQKDVESANTHLDQARETFRKAKVTLDIVIEDERVASKKTTSRARFALKNAMPWFAQSAGVEQCDADWAFYVKCLEIGKREFGKASRAKDEAEHLAGVRAKCLEEIGAFGKEAAEAFRVAYEAELSCNTNVAAAEREWEAAKTAESAAAELAQREAALKAERAAKRAQRREERAAARKAEAARSRLDTLWAVSNIYDDLLGDEQENESTSPTSSNKRAFCEDEDTCCPSAAAGGRSKRARARY